MSRRRYISTDISVDRKIRRLSDSAALLYTWMIPHADDSGVLTGDPEELQATIVPNRPGWTVDKIVKLLEEIVNEDLCDRINGYVLFPETFYKHQSYITEARREKACKLRESAQNSAKQRKTAQNAASSSSSSSSSKHLSKSPSALDEFESFWKLYPRKEGKEAARTAFKKAAGKYGADYIIEGLNRLLPSLIAKEAQFRPMPATWLNQGRWADEPETLARAPSVSRPFKPATDDEIRAREQMADFGGTHATS